MKRVIALILLIVYLGYTAGLINNDYFSGRTVECSGTPVGNSTYASLLSESTKDCHHIEHGIGVYVKNYFHLASTAKAKLLRIQLAAFEKFAACLFASVSINKLLLGTLQHSEASTKVFLKYCVLRL